MASWDFTWSQQNSTNGVLSGNKDIWPSKIDIGQVEQFGAWQQFEITVIIH
jgi:hypothetical protein